MKDVHDVVRIKSLDDESRRLDPMKAQWAEERGGDVDVIEEEACGGGGVMERAWRLRR